MATFTCTRTDAHTHTHVCTWICTYRCTNTPHRCMHAHPPTHGISTTVLYWPFCCPFIFTNFTELQLKFLLETLPQALKITLLTKIKNYRIQEAQLCTNIAIFCSVITLSQRSIPFCQFALIALNEFSSMNFHQSFKSAAFSFHSPDIRKHPQTSLESI